MEETPVLFGPDGGLMGVLAAPARASQAPVGCLLFNAGVIYRVGPHRINVKLARALAVHGIASLRMDLSGLGDSAPSRSSRGSAEQAVADLQEGIELLGRATGARRFIAVGICSGAVHAYALALADTRITGLMMFDGFTFPTAKTRLLSRWRRFRRMPWRTVPARITAEVARMKDTVRSRMQAGDERTMNTSREAFRDAMDVLVGRDTSVFIGYSGSFIELYNYDRQLHDAFRGASFLRRVRCDYMPQIDHTLTPIVAQQTFVTTVTEWARQVAQRE